MFEFLIKSGRAVMVPIYKSTYERRDDLKPFPATTISYRDHVIAWSKDLGRSIDYLETRPEIDRGKLAYEGYSWGAAMSSVMVAVEDRIKVCLLVLPGFFRQKCLPEVDLLNRAASEGSGLDVEWPLRLHLPGRDLAGADVPPAWHAQRAEAPRRLRNRPQHSPE
jgi:dienelactone hydrolase